jgi:hypothetical protein
MTEQPTREDLLALWEAIKTRYTPIFKIISSHFEVLSAEFKRVASTMHHVFNQETIEDYRRIGRYGTSANFDIHDSTWVCDMCSAWLHESCTDRELCCCRKCHRAHLNTSHKTRRA